MRNRILSGLEQFSRVVIPSLVILGLVIAPFPPPPPQESEQLADAKELYEQTYGTEASTPTIIARYTRGNPDPQVSLPPSEEGSELFASLTKQPPLAAVSATTTEEKVVVAPLVAKKSVRVSSRSQSNIAAALQVAAGTSASEIVEVGLDKNLNIAETVDEHGARTLAEYNEAGDPVKITSADGSTTYYAYDEDGNLIDIVTETPQNLARKSGEGFLAHLGRIFTTSIRTLASGSSGSDRTSLAYEDGAITELTDDSSALGFEYDESGNLLAQYDEAGDEIVYIYDEEGNIAGKEVRSVSDDQSISFLDKTLSRFFATAYADADTVVASEAYAYDGYNNLAAFSVALDDGVEEVLPTVEPQVLPIETIIPVATSTPDSAPTATTTESVPEPVVEAPATTPEPATAEVIPAESEPVLVADTPVEAVVDPVPAPVVDTPVGTPSVPAVEVPEVVQKVVAYFTRQFDSIVRTLARFMPTALAESIEEAAVAAFDVPVTVPLESQALAEWNTYDVLGNLVETQNEKGEITSYTYNNRTDALSGRTVYAPDDSVLYSISYGTDTNANRWNSRTENGTTSTYEFDQLGELIRVSGASSSSYTYDERGNRIGMETADGLSTYEYQGNRLVSATLPNGTVRTYSYDEKGNVVTVTDERGQMHFAYTPRGAVERITLSDGTEIEYAYDALNRRVARSVSGAFAEALKYYYEGTNLTRVEDGQGTVLRQYFYNPQHKLIAIRAQGAMYSAVLDGQGSLVALTDTSSRVAARFTYDAWGNPVSPLSPDLSDLYYASGFYEPLVGMYLLGPRTYDPSIGRFLQKDPLAGSLTDVISQNEYLYGGNDPVNRTDPSGHQSVEVGAGTSPKALAANARLTADQMRDIVDTAHQQLEEAKLSGIAENITDATEAYAAAKAARSAMLDIAQENEALVAELQAEAEALAVEALVVPEPLPEAAVPAPQEAATSTEPVVEPIPTPETIESVPTVPEPIVEPATTEEPPPADVVAFISSGFTAVYKKFIDNAPHALAKKKKKSKSKSAKKKSPPKKKKESKKKDPPKPKKSAKESKKSKVSASVKNAEKLSKSSKETAKAIALTTKLSAKQQKKLEKQLKKEAKEQKKLAKKQTLALSKVVQSTAVQTSKIATVPLAPSAGTKVTSLVTSATASSKIQNPLPNFATPYNNYMKEVDSAIKRVQLDSRNNLTLAQEKGRQLIEKGKTALAPVVFSRQAQDAHKALAACSFEQALIGGSCGVLDGILYALQGDSSGAGLSFGGALPFGAGFASDAAKSARLANQGANAIKMIALSDLPLNAKASFKFFQETKWSRPISTDGAKAGGIYGNRYVEGAQQLPTMPHGHYKEFDINPKGQARDAERFIKGNNGEVYMTLDHYTTFVRIQ